MSFSRTRGAQRGSFHNEFQSSSNRGININNNRSSNTNCELSMKFRKHIYNVNIDKTDGIPLKRRKYSASAWGESSRPYGRQNMTSIAPASSDSSFHAFIRPEANTSTFSSPNTDQVKLEEDDVFMSKDEIERCSPSRRDGIDSLRETHLRYSYCTFLQNLGMRLELPQSTIGTAMVLCHRFFVRRSHACHDRFLIATSALFLAAKSEETPCPLNNVLKASCEIRHKQDFTQFSYLLPVNWFEQYRERVIEAEQMILTTLNFELNVQHPFDPLTSVLNKLGLSQTVLVNLALNLISEGIFTRIACSPV